MITRYLNQHESLAEGRFDLNNRRFHQNVDHAYRRFSFRLNSLSELRVVNWNKVLNPDAFIGGGYIDIKDMDAYQALLEFLKIQDETDTFQGWSIASWKNIFYGILIAKDL